MKKEKQIGVRVGLPVFFLLELEDVYKYTQGAHRALAFPDFVGLIVGLGLEAYRKGNVPPCKEEIPEETEKGDPLHLFDMAPGSLPNLFREYEEAMEERQDEGLRLVPTGDMA